MAGDSRVFLKGSTPIPGKRLKKLLDDKRLVMVPAAAAPPSVKRMVMLDEVDAYPQAEHQRLSITTRS